MAKTITKADLIDRAKAAGRRTPEHYRLWPDTSVLRELINREWATGDQARILRGVTGDLLAEAKDYQLDGELFAAAVQAAHHPANRPRRDPAAARVNLVCRVHPDTRARFDAFRQLTGQGLGELLDTLANALPLNTEPPPKPKPGKITMSAVFTPMRPISMTVSDPTREQRSRWVVPDSKGHIWKITPQGEIDEFAHDVDDHERGGGHNGPVCIVCDSFFCKHCQETPDEPCPGLPPGMEVAVLKADNGDQVQVIRPRSAGSPSEPS